MCEKCGKCGMLPINNNFRLGWFWTGLKWVQRSRWEHKGRLAVSFLIGDDLWSVPPAALDHVWRQSGVLSTYNPSTNALINTGAYALCWARKHTNIYELTHMRMHKKMVSNPMDFSEKFVSQHTHVMVNIPARAITSSIYLSSFWLCVWTCSLSVGRLPSNVS